MRMERNTSGCQPCSGHSNLSGKFFAPGTGLSTSKAPHFTQVGKPFTFSVNLWPYWHGFLGQAWCGLHSALFLDPNLQSIRMTPRMRHAASIFVLDALVRKTVGSESKKLAEHNFAAFRRQSVQRKIREGSQWTTNQNVRSAASASTQLRARLWQPPRTKSRRHKRPRTFVPTCAPGVTLGTLRKIPEKLGRFADSSVNLRL
jgi:hypothetical protein